MKNLRRFSLLLLVWLAAVPIASAQTAPYRHDLLHLLPDDFAVCIVMHDLRGHSARWEKSAWFKQFHQSALGKSLFDAPEMKQLQHWEGEFKKHFDLDWPTLRDDIVGDALLLAYTPGPKDQPDAERGFFLLHARKPEKLLQFIDRLNDAQKKSGELKSLDAHQYKGHTYFQRDQAGKQQFYFVKDSLFVFTGQESWMRTLLDRRESKKTSTWAKRFEKAGAEKSLFAMCVNPRALDAEIRASKKKNDPLPGYWDALEAIFVTVSIRDDAELRIAIQAKPDQLPRWAKPAFTDTIPTTDLWQRFPEPSIMTMASMTDFAGSVEALKLLIPEKDRQKLATDWGALGLWLGVDPLTELLPNIGPDWGVCVLPSKDAQQVPPMLIAIAVKPGEGKKQVDQELLKSLDKWSRFVADQSKGTLGVQSVKQGKLEVKFVTSDKLFPAGFQPAYALKDGFLVFATAPDVIADFRLRGPPPAEPKESTLLRISTPELAKLLEQRREHILFTLTDRQQMTPREAKQNLENVIALLRLFDRVSLSQQGDAGQTTWIVRLSPK